MTKNKNLDIQRKFGENLKKIRMQKGLSLRALAARCDIDDSNISKIENGYYNIRLSTLLQLAKALDILPNELLCFKMISKI
ncbi:MAG: XRE family transcriptional regulator [Pedobacter sp.]|nr:MAG: XRE family transcriptional regulator [Pedobacter sp.]